jgi:hypothetical protein
MPDVRAGAGTEMRLPCFQGCFLQQCVGFAQRFEDNPADVLRQLQDSEFSPTRQFIEISTSVNIVVVV